MIVPMRPFWLAASHLSRRALQSFNFGAWYRRRNQPGGSAAVDESDPNPNVKDK
jgi:hypothetical protein